MKKCHRCLVYKPNSDFKPNSRNKDGLANCCIGCQEKRNSHGREFRVVEKPIYRYLRSLNNKRTYCMRCGRPFNYTIKEILISGSRYKKKEIPREYPLHWNYWKGFYVCDECYEDKLNGIRFPIDGKSVGMEDITPDEYKKLYKNYVKPNREYIKRV